LRHLAAAVQTDSKMTTPLYQTPTDLPGQAPPIRYRAVCHTAAASLALGVLSLVAFLSWYLAVVPVAAMVLGWRALRRIQRTPEELTGEGLAWGGIGLAALFWMLGCAWLLFARSSEVPYGYVRLSMEDLQPDPNIPVEEVPAAVLKLDGKKVYIKGYMQPTQPPSGVRRFLLSPTDEKCSYCPSPTRMQQIQIRLVPGMTTDFATRVIGVGGEFHVKENDFLPYSIDADYIY
jgi:hypothetical protein